MKYLLTILLYVIVLGCTKTNDSTLTISDSADSTKVMQNILDSLDFSILKYDTTFRYRYIFPSTFKPTDLSSAEIIECEKLLRTYVLNYNEEATKEFEEVSKKHPNLKFDVKQVTIELEEYGRQYVAGLSEDGNKVVYVNCFCYPEEFEYRNKELVVVDDGGNCFFNFKVDLKNRKIFDFRENGVA
jgi:hypothetical protein